MAQTNMQKEQPNHGTPTITTTSSRVLGLSPSPSFLEPSKNSKDDNFIAHPPVTPKRPNFSRGLSLQLPKRDTTSSSTANLASNLINRVPLSPKLDSATSLGSTASVLPRRSRGMDFSRACTNLHHSMLAEQSSPDSSPVVGGKGVNIPKRSGSGPESPMFASSLWTTLANSERTGVASSVASVNMADSGSDDSSSDEDLMRVGDEDDTIHMTPHPFKTSCGPLNTGTASPGDSFSPAAINLRSFQRRLRTSRTTRNSSSSTSRQSSGPSPGPASPSLARSVESLSNSGYFARELEKKGMASRRESLSLGTNDLHISDTIESEEPDNLRSSLDGLGIPIPANQNADGRRNVIRRAVTRRSNMLPKPKNLSRIQAALQEECSPVDCETRQEAEVIRQVRESDDHVEHNAAPSQAVTATSSPNLHPAMGGPSDGLDDLTGMMGGESHGERRSSTSFSRQAMRNSSGPDFWNNFDDRMRTPPPPLFPRGSSSGMSEDVSMDTPASSLMSSNSQWPLPTNHSSPSRSSTPQPGPSTAEATRKALGKRRRDDDLDPNQFKRRAVSPGVSLQNSPILPPSPAQREGGRWPKSHRDSLSSHAPGERASSGGSNSSNAVGKRIGMQGMNDTNDGLMNMSIE